MNHASLNMARSATSDYDPTSQIAGGAGCQISGSVGPLAEIAARINAATLQTDDLARRMKAHADAVHGPIPEPVDGARGPMPPRDGQLGEIFDHLDSLVRAQSFLAEQAGRNCALV